MEDFGHFNICPCCLKKTKEEKDDEEAVSQELIELISKVVVKEIRNGQKDSPQSGLFKEQNSRCY